MSNLFIRLFYSTTCKACNELWAVISNEGIQKMFVPVCLDKMTSKDLSKLSITKVPAIVISGENQHPAIYEGPQQCSVWLNSLIQNRRTNMKQYVENQRKLIQKNQAQARIQEGGAMEFVGDEMEGISDGYAYMSMDIYQPKNFVPVNQENNFRIITAQVNNETKIDKERMTRELNVLKGSRDQDTEGLKRMMEQNQINAIFTANNKF
jgi:hypothetical protein